MMVLDDYVTVYPAVYHDVSEAVAAAGGPLVNSAARGMCGRYANVLNRIVQSF